MQNRNEFFRKKIVLLGISTSIIAILGGCAFLLSAKSQEAASAKEALTNANKQIAKLTHDIGTQTTDAEQAKKELADLKSEIADQATDIESFAKQAAACENLKKQLNVKK